MIWFLLLGMLVVAIPLVIERNRAEMEDADRGSASGQFAELPDGVTHFEWIQGPVAVCVHGLTAPSIAWRAVARGLASMGYRTLTYDLYGRGYSDRPSGPQDRQFFIKQLQDLLEDQDVTGSFTLLGYSMGGSIATCFAAAFPDRVERLALDAFVWTGEGSPTLKERAKKLDQWRASNTRPVNRPFFHSIFNRDMPGTSEEGVADALADRELRLCDSVPTGTYLDMCANLPVCDPTKVTCPVLIIRGEHDGIATEEDLLAYFQALPNGDKQFFVIPGGAHVSFLGVNRARFWHVLHDFLTLPPRADNLGA